MLEILLDIYQYKKIGEAEAKAQSAHDKVSSAHDRISALEKRIDSLALFAQAVAEILEEKAGLHQDELLKKIEEIDLRDGNKDGRISVGGGLKCEECKRTYNFRLNKCLYCGHVRVGPRTIIS